jgi:hypothetical protein
MMQFLDREVEHTYHDAESCFHSGVDRSAAECVEASRRLPGKSSTL